MALMEEHLLARLMEELDNTAYCLTTQLVTVMRAQGEMVFIPPLSAALVVLLAPIRWITSFSYLCGYLLYLKQGFSNGPTLEYRFKPAPPEVVPVHLIPILSTITLPAAAAAVRF
jgi:hypothetical protein